MLYGRGNIFPDDPPDKGVDAHALAVVAEVAKPYDAVAHLTYGVFALSDT